MLRGGGCVELPKKSVNGPVFTLLWISYPCQVDDPIFSVVGVSRWEGAVLKRVPSAERSVMRSVLQHTKTRAAYACGCVTPCVKSNAWFCCGVIKHMYASCFSIYMLRPVPVTAVSITSFRTNLYINFERWGLFWFRSACDGADGVCCRICVMNLVISTHLCVIVNMSCYTLCMHCYNYTHDIWLL